MYFSCCLRIFAAVASFSSFLIAGISLRLMFFTERAIPRPTKNLLLQVSQPGIGEMNIVGTRALAHSVDDRPPGLPMKISQARR